MSLDETFVSTHVTFTSPGGDPLNLLWQPMWQLCTQGRVLWFFVVQCGRYGPNENPIAKFMSGNMAAIHKGKLFATFFPDHVAATSTRGKNLQNLCETMWWLWNLGVTLSRIVVSQCVSYVLLVLCGCYGTKEKTLGTFVAVNMAAIDLMVNPLSNLCQPMWKVWNQWWIPWNFYGSPCVRYSPK